jgi:3-oxoacyl-[acyl-carrier protein] reductase
MEIEEQFERLTPRYPELKGQVAVITGGAKGIGRGIVLRLAREGMRVVIADKDEESLGITMDSLQRLDTTVYGFLGDLSQAEVINKFEQTIEKFAGVDLLINNAANLDRFRLLDEHEDVLDLQLATNVRGPYLCY